MVTSGFQSEGGPAKVFNLMVNDLIEKHDLMMDVHANRTSCDVSIVLPLDYSLFRCETNSLQEFSQDQTLIPDIMTHLSRYLSGFLKRFSIYLTRFYLEDSLRSR